ncbi:Pcif1 [Acrasis kona]|uniref:Pcif1 n=1 Tax=Acrasis kona TaxID=1008807 RepID=A0AAW2YZ26_9EUKA
MNTTTHLDFLIEKELRRYQLIREAHSHVKNLVPKVKWKSNVVISRYIFVQIGAGKNTIDPVFAKESDDACLPQILGDVIASNGNDDGRDVNVDQDPQLNDAKAILSLPSLFDKYCKIIQSMTASEIKLTVKLEEGVDKSGSGCYVYVTDAESNDIIGPKIFAYKPLIDKLNSTCKSGLENLKVIYLTLLRYLLVLDSGSHQLALIYDDNNKFFGDQIKVECFASPLNRTCDHFCGAFPDVDSMFVGHIGRFQDVKFESGYCYTANPPYDGVVMHQCSETIIQALSVTKNVTAYMTIPVWDYEGLIKVYPPRSHRVFKVYMGVPYPALDTLKKTDLCKEVKIYPRDDLPYWDL